MWYQVFGTRDAPLEPAQILAHLQTQGVATTGHFRGDDQGWFQAVFYPADGESPIEVERYLIEEKDIREALHSWLLWLGDRQESAVETQLRSCLSGARQVFTLFREAGSNAETEAACLALCRYFAAQTEGVYQVDGQGFFTPWGELLLAGT
jgi:hypothetical protein